MIVLLYWFAGAMVTLHLVILVYFSRQQARPTSTFWVSLFGWIMATVGWAYVVS